MTAVSDETGRDAFVAALASLAAAISLLERTPRSKKAAASDKMFDQMIVDYKKALEEGRAALSASPVAQEPVATKKVYIKPLRTIVEIQTAYADQIRDWLNTSPPATPAGLGTDEIARADDILAEAMGWHPSENGPSHGKTHAKLRAELLALLSRAGDQSNSTHEEQSTQNI